MPSRLLRTRETQAGNRSRRLLLAGGLMLVLGARGTPPASAGESVSASAGDHLVANVALRALPEPLHAFFADRLPAVHRALTDSPAEPGEADTGGHPTESHYLMVDVAAATFAPEARRQAVRAFPLEARAARELMRAQGRPRGGTLPWALMEHYATLTQAFREQRPEAIVAAVGPIARLSARAALPLNTTVNLDGSLTGHLRWHADQLAPAAPHRSVRQRLQTVALEQLLERLEIEARLWPGRVQPCPIPLKAVFDTLVSANEALDALLEVDRAVMEELGITDAASFVGAVEPYYLKATERAAPLLEDRVEAGALLAARLIVSAWLEAGAPSLRAGEFTPVRKTPPEQAMPPAPPDSVRPAIPQADATEQTTLCASRKSKVFHYASCSHARRIRPEYLITFESCAEAEASGRKPCKTCKPCSGEKPTSP